MDYPKLFEGITKQSLIAEGACVDRLPDQMTGNLGSTNPGDFTAYKFPYFSYIECKSCAQSHFDIKQHIMEGQWLALLRKDKSNFPGVFVGYVIWFVTEHLIFWITAKDMEMLYKTRNVKTFTSKDLLESHSDIALQLETEPDGKYFRIKDFWNSITGTSTSIEEAKSTILNLVNAEIEPTENIYATDSDIYYLGSVSVKGVCHYLFKAATFEDSYWAVSDMCFNVMKFNSIQYLPKIQE